ncbi:MAG: GatB/YqeY domain-containing protein [Nitrospirae bacterium]|nr:GatB/YqeY domain-containing protein [Nitrospirota bacterium]
MSVAQKLNTDLEEAMKAADKERVSVIRMIKAAAKNREIEKRSPLTDEDIYDVLSSLARQGRDSIEQFSKGGRQDLVEKEERELLIIKSYLPEPLTQDEARAMIKAVIKETGATGPRDIGRVMKILMPKVKGRIDGRLLNELVKEAIGG